jgi:hypothetical protein
MCLERQNLQTRMKLHFSFSVIPATCHGILSRRSFFAKTEASERRRKPESRLKKLDPGLCRGGGGVTQIFCVDQTGSYSLNNSTTAQSNITINIK